MKIFRVCFFLLLFSLFAWKSSFCVQWQQATGWNQVGSLNTSKIVGGEQVNKDILLRSLEQAKEIKTDNIGLYGGFDLGCIKRIVAWNDCKVGFDAIKELVKAYNIDMNISKIEQQADLFEVYGDFSIDDIKDIVNDTEDKYQGGDYFYPGFEFKDIKQGSIQIPLSNDIKILFEDGQLAVIHGKKILFCTSDCFVENSRLKITCKKELICESMYCQCHSSEKFLGCGNDGTRYYKDIFHDKSCTNQTYDWDENPEKKETSKIKIHYHPEKSPIEIIFNENAAVLITKKFIIALPCAVIEDKNKVEYFYEKIDSEMNIKKVKISKDGKTISLEGLIYSTYPFGLRADVSDVITMIPLSDTNFSYVYYDDDNRCYCVNDACWNGLGIIKNGDERYEDRSSYASEEWT